MSERKELDYEGMATLSREQRMQAAGWRVMPVPEGAAMLTMRGGYLQNAPGPGDDVELYVDQKGKGSWQGGFVALSGIKESEVGGPYDGEDVIWVGRSIRQEEGVQRGDEWPAKYCRLARGEKPTYREADKEAPDGGEGTGDSAERRPDAPDAPEADATFASTVPFYRTDQRRAPRGQAGGGRWVSEGRIQGHARIEQPIPVESAKVIASANKWLSERGVEHEKLVQRIVELVGEASPEHLTQRDWYYRAHDLVEGWAAEFGIPVWRVAGVLSATSPQTAWDDTFDPATNKGTNIISNQAIAYRVLQMAFSPGFTNKRYEITPEAAAEYERAQQEGWAAKAAKAQEAGEEAPRKPRVWSWARYNGVDTDFAQGTSFVGTFKGEDLPADIQVTLEQEHLRAIGTNAIKALRIARGQDPADVLGGGGKTRSFYNNILEPDVSEDVTVDVHMARAMLDNPDLDDDDLSGMVGRGSRYQVFANALKEAARLLGLRGHEAQAIAWYVWRTANPAGERGARTRKRNQQRGSDG